MTLRVVAHLTAKADKIEETRAALQTLIDPTCAEEGCIRYELMQNNAEPTDFAFVEEWSSNEALDLHLQTDHIKLVVSKAEELLAAPPDIRRYTLLA